MFHSGESGFKVVYVLMIERQNDLVKEVGGKPARMYAGPKIITKVPSHFSLVCRLSSRCTSHDTSHFPSN